MSRHRRPKASKPPRMQVKSRGFCPGLVSRRRATGAVLTVQVGAPVFLGMAALFTSQAPIPLSGMDLTSPPSLFAPAPSPKPVLALPSGPGASIHGTFGFPLVLGSGAVGSPVDVPNLLRVASVSDIRAQTVLVNAQHEFPGYVGRHRFVGPPCHPASPVVVVTPPVDTAPPPSDPPPSNPAPSEPDPLPAPSTSPESPAAPEVPISLPVEVPSVPDVVSDPVGTVTDTVQDTAGAVADTVDHTTDTVKDTTGDVVGTVKDTVDSVVDAPKDDSPPKDTSDSAKSDSGNSDTTSNDSSSDKSGSDSKSDSSGDSKSDSSGSDSSSTDTHSDSSGDSHDSN